MSEFAVFVEGIENLQDFSQLKQDIKLAAVRAINKTARDSRSRAARVIRDQVNLPASYVSPGQKRLYVSKQAQRGSLEARITARGRATSLARFVQGNPRPGKAGVSLSVSPGKARYSKRMFIIRLPGQDGATDSLRANLGLAIRLRPGETLTGKNSVVRVAKGLYLLYGPSVAQVFRSNDGTGVANDLVPEIERDLGNEFLRLLDI